MAQNRFVLLHQDGQYLSINDGSHWIGVSDPMAATVLSETKANNILQNMIKPKEREFWRIQPFTQLAEAEKPIVEEIPQEEVPALEHTAAKPSKQPRQRKKKQPAKSEETATVSVEPSQEETPLRGKKVQAAKVVPSKAHPMPNEAVKPDESPCSLIDEWIKRAGAMKQEYDQLLQRKKDLTEQLRQVSAELCDLEHYIEFHSLNAVKGYRMYRKLRDCLIRRRKIKDELMCITIFLKAEPHNIMNGNLIRQFSGLLTREYAPRVLQDLFEEKDSEPIAKEEK